MSANALTATYELLLCASSLTATSPGSCRFLGGPKSLFVFFKQTDAMLGVQQLFFSWNCALTLSKRTVRSALPVDVMRDISKYSINRENNRKSTL